MTGVVLSARATGDDVVPGAIVTLAGRAPITADESGAFVIEGVPPGPVALVITGPDDADDVFGTTEIRGQVGAGKTFDVRANLLPACERIFPADTGADVACGAARLVFEPGDVAEVDGRSYAGPVRVVWAAADPQVPAQLAAAPVDLAADPMEVRGSSGLVDVRLFDALDGRPLQVAPGRSVGVSIPVASAAGPLSLAFWDGARWIDEPGGTLSGGLYSFEASHFTIRNVQHPEYIWARGIACLRVPVSADVSFAVEGIWIETDVGFLYSGRDPVTGDIQVPASTTIEKLHATVSVLFPGTGVVLYSGQIAIDDTFVPGEACQATPTLPLSRPQTPGCLRGEFDVAHCAGAPGCWVKARRRGGPQIAATRPSCSGNTCSFCLNGPGGEQVDLVLPSGAWFPGESFAGTPICSSAPGGCRSVAASPQLGVEFVRADFTYVATPAGAGFDVALDASPTMGTILTYEWKVLDDTGVAIQAANSTGPSFSLRLPSAAVYKVRLRAVGTAGGVSITEREIAIGGVPLPSFTVGPQPAPVNTNVTFLGTASTPITRWQWDFTDDGTFDAEGQTVTTTYASEGLHTARLRVTDGAGLSGETTRAVQIGPVGAPLTVEIQGQGRVISNDERVVCFATCTVNLPLPYNVTLLASPAQGWTLGTWQNCDSTNGPACNLMSSTPRTVRVTFLPPS